MKTINTVLDPLEDKHAELIPLRRVCDAVERILVEVAPSDGGATAMSNVTVQRRALVTARHSVFGNAWRQSPT